jgi:hypothetical protein
MAAGLGFKDFVTGEVLTAADVDGYLMQGIWVFASATARDAAVTSPQEGNFAFLKDTNTTTYYTGSAWTNLDTTGMVNPMTTTGDTIYSSSGSTPARLGIGTAGQVLQVNSGATAPEWATPAAGGGGFTLINTGGTTLTGASTSITSIPGTYKHLYLVLKKVYFASTGTLYMTLNNDGTNNYSYSGISNVNTTISGISSSSTSGFYLGVMSNSSTVKNLGEWAIWIPLYTDTNSVSVHSVCKTYNGTSTASRVMDGIYDGSAAVTSIELIGDANFSGGTAYLYGVN